MCAMIFIAAAGIRLLHWQDNRQAIPFIGMTGEYKSHAMRLVAGDLNGFVRGQNPPSDANVIKHPPGYPLFMALVYEFLGDDDVRLQFVHIVLDSLAALLVFVLALELFSFAVATVAGFMVAISPQLAYHSIALLPDPLATGPLLLAFFLLARAIRRPGLKTLFAAGTLIGISCWLRSNALLLPFFIAALVPLFFERGKRIYQASAVVLGAVLVIAPVTIRNYLVFKSFVPLSLSAGITLVVGIGLFDKDHRFGLPATDIGVMSWEANKYHRPDYLCGRFAPDGVERERRRTRAGLDVILHHPFWFAGVMSHRAVDMLRLTRVENVAAVPAVTNSLNASELNRFRSITPSDIFGDSESRTGMSLVTAAQNYQSAPDASVDCSGYTTPGTYAWDIWANARKNLGNDVLHFQGPATTVMFSAPPINVKKNTDYLLKIPLRIQQGSVVIDVVDAQRGTLLGSTPIEHSINWAELRAEQQPFTIVVKPFVSTNAEQVRIVFRNGYRKPAELVTDVGRIDGFELGPATLTWVRYPRLIIRGMQNLFLTAVWLPLLFAGGFGLIRARRYRELTLLLVVPLYYMCIQSLLWTEFRYVLPMYYFLFILAAVGICWIAETLWQLALGRKAETQNPKVA